MTDQLPGDIFTVGQVLNNTYHVDRILGRGGTGEVYLASNQITGRQVAIKALNRAFSGNADYIELMKREEEMRAIQHPAVVRYTECSRSDDNHVFLVMDFVDGPPLSDVMASSQMDPRDLMIIAHRVLEGLVATHAKGIIHRDLSPDNIILRGGDPAEATLIDFGIAKDTATGARTIVGSDFAGKYEYSAPEQFEGTADARTDLYALGATLLAAFRGETPFARATPGEIIRRKSSALDTKGVPEPLKAIIEKLTAPDPKNRPQNAADMADEVAKVLKPKRNAGTAKKGKPRRSLMPALLVVLAAGIGGGAWFLGIFDPAPPAAPPERQVYRLSLSFDPDTPPLLNSNAPTAEDGAALRAAVADAYGRTPGGEITVIAGAPSDTWVQDAADLMERLSALDNGELDVRDVTASITGLAIDVPTKAALVSELTAFGDKSGWAVTSEVIAGPLTIDTASLQEALAGVADCGPLTVTGGTDGSFGLSDPVTVTGQVATTESRDTVLHALGSRVGERTVTAELQVLNSQLCEIRQALIAVPSNVVSISMTNGETGDRNLSGVFTTGQNPVVDVIIPDTYADGALWVMAVNPDGSVFHVVPNIYNEEFRISALAEVEAGLRRIRVLHSLDEFAADNRKLAFKIEDGEYGKSEIIVILSQDALFEGRRPTTESVASTALALREAFANRPENLLGVTSSIVDARP